MQVHGARNTRGYINQDLAEILTVTQPVGEASVVVSKAWQAILGVAALCGAQTQISSDM